MSEAISKERTQLGRAMETLLSSGRAMFSLAIIALGIETFLCAHSATFLYSQGSNSRFKAIPILPFLPAIPWLAYMFGPVLAACGAGLLSKRTVRIAAIALGSLQVLCTLVLEVPKYAAIPGNMSLRTVVFEPLAIGVLAWLLPGRDATPSLLARVSRYLLAVSFIVFGVDHFLALAPIGTLVPNWIPWHVFWIAFFGAGFIAAGLSIGFDFLLRWGAAGIGLMFAIWVFTLHLPRVLGLYGIPGAPRSPAEWSSLFIAIALWGGSWALAYEQ
jgi:putative oxidoreductase